MLRLVIPKGKTEISDKIIRKATGLWKQAFRIGRALETEERQVTSDEGLGLREGTPSQDLSRQRMRCVCY
jgi:hypothetical protein